MSMIANAALRSRSVTLSSRAARVPTSSLRSRTFFTIVHQGHEAWRLSLGRNPTRLNPGFNIAIPIYHTVQEIDLREQSVNIKDLAGFTSDNVPVSISGSLFFRVVDGYNACFSVHDFASNVEKIGTSAMRSVMGGFNYDEVIGDRNKINLRLREVIGNTITQWGVDCTRFEIQTFKPSNREVERQLELQMEAERNRRKQLLDTQAQVNVAEGHKQRTILESEGALQAQLNEAKGRKEQTIVESQGDLEAAINEGKALSAQVEILAQALGPDSPEARQKALSALLEMKRLELLGSIAKGDGNTTYFFGEAKGTGRDAYEVDGSERWKKDLSLRERERGAKVVGSGV